MNDNNMFTWASSFKSKFAKLWLQKKQANALKNFSQSGPFQHKHYLLLIKKCLDEGFLGEEEARFLSHMVNKYFGSNSECLAWAHKTKWIKDRIESLASQKAPENQLDFFQ